MTDNKLHQSYNSEEENTQHDLQEAKQNLLTLEALIKMRSKNIPQANDDGTKKDEDFDIDPIPGYGGAW
ncbi:hypothetical protein LBMAG27_05260 [Bacteroidota bacterium]|nr:hypothetical protein LBMAG27_05260 [Bacteroidota bacterium]